VRGILREFGYELHPTKGWWLAHRRDELMMVLVILTQYAVEDSVRQHLVQGVAALRLASDALSITRRR